jgi:hypothetical protein
MLLDPDFGGAAMAGFLQLTSVVYVIAVWTGLFSVASDPTDALVLVSGMLLSLPALPLAFYAPLIGDILGARREKIDE